MPPYLFLSFNLIQYVNYDVNDLYQTMQNRLPMCASTFYAHNYCGAQIQSLGFQTSTVLYWSVCFIRFQLNSFLDRSNFFVNRTTWHSGLNAFLLSLSYCVVSLIPVVHNAVHYRHPQQESNRYGDSECSCHTDCHCFTSREGPHRFCMCVYRCFSFEN